MLHVKGREPDRSKYVTLGKYLLDALKLAGWTQTRLAQEVGMQKPDLSDIMRGTGGIGRDKLLLFCDKLNPPYWLEEKIMHSACYATRKEKEEAENEAEIEAAHQRVLHEIAQEPPG